MSIVEANERLIVALCELHNAEIQFVISRIAYFAENNPNASAEEVAAKGPQFEDELQKFKDSIREIIEEEVNNRRKGQNTDDLPKYPKGSIERMISDLLDELE